MSTSFYRAFEDRYRGERSIIKQRLSAYLDFLAPLEALPQPLTALDLGCGRGEWLELLAEQGIPASGVDLDSGMLEGCLERGLTVRQADAIGYLREQPDSSLALISAFHLVEHLPYDLVQEMLMQAKRVLMPGGLLILETPNPENLSVGASSFYLDPSHERPIPPPLLDFTVEFAGFKRHKIVRLQEDPRLHTSAAINLLDVLQGVSPDYAIVAQKDADADVLRGFDTAFDVSYGTTLELMAQRYEQQNQQQFFDIHRAMQYAASSQQALNVSNEERQARINQRFEQLEWLSAQQELHIAKLEHRGAELEQRIIDILQSRSWRITAPMRWCSTQLAWLARARREKRLLSAVRRRTANVASRLAHAMLRRPWLKRCILQLLERHPQLRTKLKSFLFNTVHATAPVPAPNNELSPREQHIYQRLQQALDARKN